MRALSWTALWGIRLFTRDRSFETDAPSTTNVVPFRSHKRGARALVVSRRDDDATGGGAGAGGGGLVALTEEQLRAIETQYPEGLTAVQLVDAFTRNRVRFSEASFRKYVQQGLLPRSKRVGRKGKHKGSLGVYPAKTVRRINQVKRLMADGYTIEEIQGQVLLYTDLVEGVEENVTELVTRLQRDCERLEPASRKEVAKELTEVRKEGDRLVERLSALATRVSAPRTDTLRLAGAAGGAEDLF
ncbi:MAG TPA: MerR family transcriptional regulator [Kofleriaceae bacterium]|nr:MerR family transcriptional regulator [Kofleriaceae bacterium]